MIRRLLRLSSVRTVSQTFFGIAFLLALWASWSGRLGGYPVARFLELDPLVGLATFLATGYVYRALGWGVLTLVVTLLFGRVFCGWFCPFGALHQLIGRLLDRSLGARRRECNRYRSSQVWKYALLVALLATAPLGVVQIGLLDPICLLTRSAAAALTPAWDLLAGGMERGFTAAGVEGTLPDALRFAPGARPRVFQGAFWIGSIVLALLGLNLAIPRFFCRFLCPLGALLGATSRFSLGRIRRDPEACTDCGLCVTRCQGASEPHRQIRLSECLGCMNCLDDCPEDALSFSLARPGVVPARPGTDLGRRRLVLSGLTGLLTVPFLRSSAGTTDRDYSPALIRPPGSVEEPDFLRKCVQCGQCIKVCPTNVLQPAAGEAGPEGLWTPILDFDIGHCQYKCALCSQVCPTGAIRRLTVAEKLGRGEHLQAGPIALGTAFIDPGRCLPHAFEIPCVVCEEVCPVAPKAVQTRHQEVKDAFGRLVVLQKPFILPELCIGCGICQSECPVTGRKAIVVTPVGESRSRERRLLLSGRDEKRSLNP